VRIIDTLGVIATLVSHAAVAADVRHRDIPDSFLGIWAPNAQVCKDADKSVIVISANTYVSSEAHCMVDWVTETAGPRGPIYSAHLQCFNPSEPARRSASNLIIRPEDTNQISVGPDFGNLKVYGRCSTNEPAIPR
jgi:hypothetical protein